MMQSRLRRVWIIGARGFLGAALHRLLPHALGFDPSGSCGSSEGAYIPACVQAPGAISRAMQEFGAPCLVYFCAASHGGDAEAYRRAYAEPVSAVAAAVPKARLVLCSSTAVYEGHGTVTEDSPTPGSTAKLRVLLAAERAALAAGGVVARLAPLYGPGRCELLRRHLAGEPQLPGAPDRVLNYLHVASAARALYLLGATEHLPHRVFNVCDESFTKAQVYALLAELTGVPVARAVSPALRRGISDHRVLAERLCELGDFPRRSFAHFVRESLA